MAWYERSVDLSPRNREDYARHILTIGRWLYVRAPEIHTPEQWTEDLALRFRADLCSWTGGMYTSSRGQQILESRGKLGTPLKPGSIAHYLTILRRYLSDLIKRAHAVGEYPARKIRLDFNPQEVLSLPAHIKRAVDAVAPRDIDLLVWAKLTIAAATLSESDLPPGTRYPLSFFRALALIWVTSARRPNEIVRLRRDCVREDWDREMLDEENHPVERIAPIRANGQGNQEEMEDSVPKICYLYIPAGKNRGGFWIWIPDYVTRAIDEWKRERPPAQRKLLDRKEREEVDYLFCLRDMPVSQKFLNETLIPTLCAHAGVDIEDAKGRITGHRGRSTRLTLLQRNGVGLDDLAEYAGHSDTRTIRRYVSTNVIHLHRVVRAADDLSRIIEGVIDVQAAAKGLPALRWFIGYDADGEPMYCGNQVYHTCPHRLECVKCGMFIGGEKARLLHNGENTLPITSKAPMSPVEKCVFDGDQEGAERCQAALAEVPAPEAPDLNLIFNPEGLSNQELERLAQLATTEALDTLRQALDTHKKKLVDVQQIKDGRNALVSGQKKHVKLLQKLIEECERRMNMRQE